MKRLSALLVLLPASGCGSCRHADAPPAPDAGSADAAAPAEAPRAGRFPTTIEAIGFTRDGSFATFQGAGDAFLVDLRAKRGRIPTRPFEIDRGELRTVYAGKLGRLNANANANANANLKRQPLEDLATGKLVGANGAEAYEAYIREPAPDATRLHFYDGREVGLPPKFEVVHSDAPASGEMLQGEADNEGKHALSIGDPESGNYAPLDDEVGRVVSGRWLAADRSRMLLLYRAVEDGGEARLTSFGVYEFPSGRTLTGVTARGAVLETRVSSDGAIFAWTELISAEPPSSCGLGMLDPGSGSLIGSEPFACPESDGGRRVAIVSVDPAHVVVSTSTFRSFDPKTGRLTTIAAPKPIATKPAIDAGAGLTQASPDGKKVAVVTSDKLRVLDATSGAVLFEAPRPK